MERKDHTNRMALNLERTTFWREVAFAAIGGAWTFYMFVAIGRKQADLDEQIKTLDIATKGIDREQKAIDLEKGKIDLSYEQTSKQLAEDIGRLDIASKQRDTIYSSDHRFQIDTSLEIFRSRWPDSYVARLTFSVINTSPSDFELSYVIVDHYVGRMVASDAGISFINPPNDSRGSVVWKYVAYEGGFVADKQASLGSFTLSDRAYVLRPDAVGVGVVKSGGHNPVQRDFLVNAKSADVVGFVIHFGLDQGNREAAQQQVSRTWLTLPRFEDAKPR